MNSPPNTTTDQGGDSGEQMEQKGAGETIGADKEVAGDERTPEVSRMNTRRGRTSMGGYTSSCVRAWWTWIKLGNPQNYQKKMPQAI